MKNIIEKYRLFPIVLILLIVKICWLKMRLLLSYSVDLDGLEFYFANCIQRLQQGINIYGNPEILPYSNCLYTPIYFYLTNTVVRLCHIDVFNEMYHLLIVGRLLSYIFIGLQIVYLIKLIKRHTSSTAIILTGITLYAILITGHMYAMRPDSLKILFFIQFLYYSIEYFAYTNKLADAVKSIAAATLAIYTKQDESIFIGIFLLTLLFVYRNKKVLYIMLSIAVCAGIALLVCRLLFGKYIFTNWILLNLQTTTGIYTIVFLYILLPSIFKTAPILLLVLLNNIKIRKESEPPLIYKVIAYSGIIFYITAHLSLLRAGANLNYTYELTVILVLNLVLFIHLYKQKLLQNKIRNQLLFIAYIILLYIANIEVNNYAYDAAKEAELKKEYFQNIKERKEIQSIIKDSYTFFPNTKYSIYYTDKNIVLGHDMHLDRFIRLFTTIVYKSKLLFISTDKYDTDFKNGTIKYIITDNDKKNMEHVAEYYPHFKPYKIIGTKLIYQYNNLSIND